MVWLAKYKIAEELEIAKTENGYTWICCYISIYLSLSITKGFALHTAYTLQSFRSLLVDKSIF